MRNLNLPRPNTNRTKLKKISDLQKIVKNLKRQNNAIVFTNGCFDILHPGHIKVIKTAKNKGQILIVAINSDKSIKLIKDSGRPILSQKARVELISAIEYVDYVVLFDEPTPYKLIKALKPDILVKGGDWQKKDIVGNNLVKKVFCVKLLAGHSTTNIIKKIIRKYKNGQKKNFKSNRCKP
jgi:D-beta-D-heptose 7-phosphate kinase/D-beta-D-heptose 1-phosphate adenosyltransferase